MLRPPGSIGPGMRRPVLLSLLLTLLAPAAASATTVSVHGGVLHIAGEPGEANRIAVTPSWDGSGIRVTDEGARVSPAVGCVSAWSRAATCMRGSVRAIGILAGDRNDEVAVKLDLPTLALGGEGADTLTTAGGDDRLLG